jgi:hypothetical protein
MYSHWQASWRSGVGLGAAVVAAIFILAGPINGESNLQKVLLGLAFILGACIYTVIITIAFRIGLHFSGRSRVDLKVVVVAPALYAASLAAVTFVRFQTHAQLVDVVTARDALIHNVVVPSVVFLAMFLLLPALVACGTARVIGGRSGVA